MTATRECGVFDAIISWCFLVQLLARLLVTAGTGTLSEILIVQVVFLVHFVVCMYKCIVTGHTVN